MEKGSNDDGDESGGHFPVPAGCRQRNFVPPKLVFDGRGDRNRFWRKGVWNQGFLRGGKNRGQRGHREGPPGSQEGAWRGLGLGRAMDPSGVLVVAPPLSSLVISEASGALIFYITFPEFLEHF